MTAERGARRRRGEPLAALVLLLAGWTGARFLLWESPFAPAAAASGKPSHRAVPERWAARPVTVKRLAHAGGTTIESWRAAPLWLPASGLINAHRAQHWPRPLPIAGGPPIAAVRSSLIDAQALAQSSAQAKAPETGPVLVQPRVAPWPIARGRWHLAAWLAWREGSGLPRVANGAEPAGYGGSQAGALAQFDLSDGPHRPALHLRVAYAPERPRQSELAAGVGVRPLAVVPVRVLGEVRATRTEGRTEARPALLAVTELVPVRLPLGLSAEGYAQAGWVGGRYATAFADAQARVTRDVASGGRARIRIGAGAWGGAQKFAERLDVGPTVMLDVAPVRLALDYRVQVAGNASPGDGLALTLSTGF